MKKISALALCALLLLLTACAPTGEAAPTPTPVSTPESTPIPTQEPARFREWVVGEGYSYTSETIGIRVEFPPMWALYFTCEEEDVEHLYASGKPGRVIELAPTLDMDFLRPDAVFGRIYWIPAGEEREDTESGALAAVTLWESDEGRYICEMDTMLQLGLSSEEHLGYLGICDAVQNGILYGRWELEVLEPKA